MCIKEDGSAEGVLPRTCISNSPIAARRSPSNKSIPGPFQNNQRRHSPPSGSNGSSAPLYPSHQDQGQGQGQNRAGPPMNNNNRGPQYRPQQGQGQGRPQQGRPQQGRPMSPAMSANGRNSPGPGNYAQGSGPQYRPQQGPMSPTMNRGPPQAQQSPQTPQQQQGQQQQSPSSPPPHAISSPPPSSSGATAGSSSPAQVPLPSSPALSQGSGGFSIPEVTVTAPSGVAGVVVERKPVGVGRKPVPGQ